MQRGLLLYAAAGLICFTASWPQLPMWPRDSSFRRASTVNSSAAAWPESRACRF